MSKEVFSIKLIKIEHKEYNFYKNFKKQRINELIEDNKLKTSKSVKEKYFLGGSGGSSGSNLDSSSKNKQFKQANAHTSEFSCKY